MTMKMLIMKTILKRRDPTGETDQTLGTHASDNADDDNNCLFFRSTTAFPRPFFHPGASGNVRKHGAQTSVRRAGKEGQGAQKDPVAGREG